MGLSIKPAISGLIVSLAQCNYWTRSIVLHSMKWNGNFAFHIMSRLTNDGVLQLENMEVTRQGIPQSANVLNKTTDSVKQGN